MLNIQQALFPFTGEALKRGINGTKGKGVEGKKISSLTPYSQLTKCSKSEYPNNRM